MAADADDRVTEGLAHLQAAAREAIAAARAFLDVAEDLLADRAAASAVADAVGVVRRTAAQRGRQSQGPDTAEDRGGAARVQRIRVN